MNGIRALPVPNWRDPCWVALKRMYPDMFPDIAPATKDASRNLARRIAHRYKVDVLNHSSSEVVIFLWLPKFTDLRWGAAIIQKQCERLWKNADTCNAELREKTGASGHAALLWKGPHYASFWPQPGAANGQAQGEFRELWRDLCSESQLPHVVLANLGPDSLATFQGLKIISWDIERLQQVYEQKFNNPPFFDLKARGKSHSCSSMVLDIVSQCCLCESEVKEWSGICLINAGIAVAACLAFGLINMAGSIAGFNPGLSSSDFLEDVGSHMLLPPAAGLGISSFRRTACLAERSVRDHTINPNYIRNMFSRRIVVDDGRMMPPPRKQIMFSGCTVVDIPEVQKVHE